jgi:hypothetical protein
MHLKDIREVQQLESKIKGKLQNIKSAIVSCPLMERRRKIL